MIEADAMYTERRGSLTLQLPVSSE